MANRRNTTWHFAVMVATECADRSLIKLEDLLAGKGHTPAVGAVEVGSGARLMPLAQQPDLQLRLTEKLVPTEHSQVFGGLDASPAGPRAA